MNKKLLVQLNERGFRQANEREEFSYIAKVIKSLFDSNEVRKEKEEKINEMKIVKKEFGLTGDDMIVPIDFVIPGEE